MPIQDLFASRAKHETLREEKAIVRAVIRYFEKAAPHRHASGADMESSIVNALHRYFQGWVGYFGLVPIRSCFSELDKWIRRRLRCCYWKQWRSCPHESA